MSLPWWCEPWPGSKQGSLTNGKRHKRITLLKLPFVIQEALGVEILGVGEELGVSQHGAQHREHFRALKKARGVEKVGRKKGVLEVPRHPTRREVGGMGIGVF